jgi:TPP-dependent pyruvate/acetoin dehydrogenase alpha subunit
VAWKHSPVIPKTPLSLAQSAHRKSVRNEIHSTVPSSALMLRLYRNMIRIRAFESSVLENAKNGASLAIHPYTGEEAVSTGVCSVLKKQDKVVTNHRPFGHFISKGGSMNVLMAELYGKSNGVCKGLGGEMNLSEPKIGFLMSDMIVGACITMCFFGEAASANGAFHEGLMMASLWGLPILYVCENNGYSTNTPAAEFLSNEIVAPRVAGYGIRTMVVDGTDVIGVRQRTEEALWQIRHSLGPCFVEAIVKRIGPHKQELVDSRSEDERRIARMRDPIKMFRSQLMEERILTDALDIQMNLEATTEVEEATRFAEKGDRLTSEQAQRFVYSV